VSADTPGVSQDRVPRDDHKEPVELASSQQQSIAGVDRQPAETGNRAEYNTARHAEPPIGRQGDPAQGMPADRHQPVNGADRHTEQVAAGKAADADTGGARQAGEPRTRSEYNTARHAESPVRQPDAPMALERPKAGEESQSGSSAGDQTRPEGPDTHYPWLSVAEADRTVGDTTPTGIGLKPTGEQLRDMEGDNPSRSRLDRLLDRAVDRADDIHDAAGENAEAITAFRHPDPALSAHQAYTGHAARDHPQPQGPPVNDMVGSTVVVTVAALAGIRRWMEHQRKEHEP
jgi:hypothetical protein